jgi:hypothetical protein
MSGMISKLERIDRRVIYGVLIIVVLAVLLHPIGLPIPISTPTQRYQNAISSLPAGSKVIFCVEFDAGALGEMGPEFEATFRLLLKSNVKFVMVSLWSGGPAIAQIYLDKLKSTIDASGKRYGQDFILTPYLAGGETAIAAMTKDFKNTIKNDFYGTPVDSLPVLKDITDAKSFSLVIVITAGTPGVEEYLRQWQSPFGTNMIAGALGVSSPTYIPYYNSGQIKGMLQGLRGAAELELLINSPGVAVSSMDALSAGHLVVIAFMVLGNIMFVLNKYGPKEK